MNLLELIKNLDLEVANPGVNLDRLVEGGYATDLLSCAMGKAKKDYVWITLQSHLNIVAVGSLLGLAAIVVAEGNRPDEETLKRASSEDVPILLTKKTTYIVVGEMFQSGIQAG